MKKVIFLLGLLLPCVGFSQDLKPYLQSPKSNSIWVSWKTANETEATVEYGTDPSNLNMSATGNVVSLSGDYQWHRTQLTNLTPNTPYYYRVVSGTQSSTVERFRSQVVEGTSSGHYRFIVIGDHQRTTDPITNQRYKRAVDMARAKAEAHFGTPIEDHISLVVNLGDQVNGDQTSIKIIHLHYYLFA